MIPPVFDESELPTRLRNLLATEIDRIATDLEWRKPFLLEVWSRHRDRGPFLDTLFSRWRTLAMSDLALIEIETITSCEAFFRELDELRMYFQFTQDMPTTMESRYEEAVVRVRAYANLAIQLLGGVPTRPIVDFAAPSEPAQHAPRLTDHALAEVVVDIDGTRPATDEPGPDEPGPDEPGPDEPA